MNNKWKREHPEEHRKYRRDWQRRWRAANPEKDRIKQHARITRTFNQYLNKCLQSARRTDLVKHREFNISLEYVMSLLEKQNYLCAVSGVLLTHNLYDPFAASIDRIDSNKGHVVGNIQIVCVFVQLGKARFEDSRCREIIKQIQLNLLKDLKEQNLLKLPSP
jgi:hypothetical protein